MSDPFATFQLEARPWLEPAVVQQTFLGLAGRTHPDTQRTPGDGVNFQEVTAAHQILRDPVKRLEAVLRLECPEILNGANGQVVPNELPDLFMSVATLHRQISAFCGQQSRSGQGKAGPPSPLSTALVRGEAFSLQSDLVHLSQKVNQQWERCENQVRATNAVWERRTPEILRHLASVYREMCYLQRWKAQLKEAELLLKTVG
jgi:curved DNA-binding protein CbpA